MKHRMSVTIDETTLLAIFEKLRDSKNNGDFRNKSHFVECAIKKFLKDGEV